jgi:hypothetical protein
MSKREREDKEAESDSDVDDAVQQAADAELLKACSEGTVVEVKAALRKGARVNAVGGRAVRG